MNEREEIIIEPSRTAEEEAIPGSGIFCLNPGDAVYLGKKAREAGGRRRFLFNSSLHVVVPGQNGSEGLFVAGPAVGAPMAAMTLEKLIALGCSRVVVWSWCGSLVPSRGVGDLVIATAGISEEGTSRHYPVKIEDSLDLAWRRRLQDRLSRDGWRFSEGKLWSTDAPYRETRDKLNKYVGRGAVGVDMEFTALEAVAAFRSIELTTLLIVSDELWGDKWRPGFAQRDFKRKCRAVLDGLFAWLLEIQGQR